MIRKKRPPVPPLSRPPQKAMASVGASDFPAIGMTLSSYRPEGFSRRQHTAAVPEKHRDIKKTLKRMIIIILIIVLVAGGWDAWKFIVNFTRTFHGGLFGLFSTQKLKGEDTGHVNILLAGNSADDPGHNGANLTDSIMLASINTRNNTALLISIPRDLYVNVPGYGYQKINAVYEDGQADGFDESGYPAGGMGLLEQVVSSDFGVPIDYYALIDYSALRDAVNAVGGITVTIHSSDPRGLYDPDIDWTTHGPLVRLSNGTHTLDGEQALDLARARGDAYGSYGFPMSDFNRTQNQRMMIVALKSKITSAGVLSNPIKVGELFDSMGNNIRTDFQTSEVRRLYQIGSKIPNSSIQSIGLNDANGKNLLASYYSYTYGDSLIPAAGLDDYSDIQAYVNQLMNPPATSSSSSSSTASTASST